MSNVIIHSTSVNVCGFDPAFPFQNSFTANFPLCCHCILNCAGAEKKEIQPGDIVLIYYQILSTQIKKELYEDCKEILYFECEVKSEISTYVEGLHVHVHDFRFSPDEHVFSP